VVQPTAQGENLPLGLSLFLREIAKEGQKTVSKTDFIEEFRQHLVADGKSPKTVASYTGDVQAFLAWLESKGTAFDGRLTRFQVTTYLKHLSGAGLLANTINKKVNSLLGSLSGLACAIPKTSQRGSVPQRVNMLKWAGW
jgi:hypothetical protein